MANFIGNLVNKMNGNLNGSDLANQTQFNNNTGIEIGNMNQLGYTRAGRNNGDSAALSNSFQLIKSGQIVDENNNEQKRKGVIESLDRKINDLKEELSEDRAVIAKIDQVKLPSIEEEIKSKRQKIDQVRSNARNFKFSRNRFNLVLIWTGFIAGFIYLYLFYVSAIHSALFRNIAGEIAGATQDNVGLLLNNVFNIGAFKEFNIHWLAPVVFFIFAVILHFSLEIKSKMTKWLSVCLVIIFVIVADGLLAYYIEKNNHILSQLMGLSDESWHFYKSSGFYLVLFFGFFTSMGWSLILHKLAREYEAINPERQAEEEIAGIEKTLKQLYAEKGIIGATRIEELSAVTAKEEKIKGLDSSKANVHYSMVDLEKNIDDFYSGWLSYLNGLKSGNNKKQECESVYAKIKTEYFNKSLTA